MCAFVRMLQAASSPAASKIPQVQVEEMQIQSSAINARNNNIDLDNVLEKAVKSIASIYYIEIIDGNAVASITTEDALEADEVDEDVNMESIDGNPGTKHFS